jgi:hypothetical protein
MKLPRPSSNRRQQQKGFFLVIVMLVLAAILLLYSAANGRRLANLRDEIRLTERQQIQRLNHSSNVSTNPITTATGTPAATP